MADTSNVTAAKPKVGGAVHSAPLATELPTDATTALPNAFKSLGYISDDGLENEDTRSNTDVKAWGGDVVLSTQTEKTDKFKYKLIEALNVDVLKEIYGDGNIEGTLETGIEVRVNSTELVEHVIVIDTVLKGGIVKRIVIPQGKIVEMSAISYKDDEALGYEVTIQAFPSSSLNGDTHVEYIKKAG